MEVDETNVSSPEEELVQLVPDQGETEEDLTPELHVFSASVASRDWTVETIVSQMRKGRIDLSPSFQRRNAWLDNRKSKLIESMLLGFPIPQIVLAERRDLAGHYFVLDGKQRLLALRQFFLDPDDPRDEGFQPLALRNLEVLSELNHKTLADLDRDAPALAARLENYTIRTVVLSDWSSEDMLLSLFLRLNTGSVQLSAQELRQALIPGKFISWLDVTSGELPSLRSLLGNSHPDRRMADAELMLRHLSFTNSPLEYRGNLKSFLDDTSRFFNDRWAELNHSLRESVADFDAALVVVQDLFGDAACRKWSGTRFERALNRAVFDVQVYSLSHSPVRVAMSQSRDSTLEAFKQACVENDAFVRAISTTTKTTEAFTTRHRVWARIVHETCGVTYDLPRPLQRG